MANVRVKVDTSKLRKNLDKVRPAMNKAAAKFLPTELKRRIALGISPVKGHGKNGRFLEYSDSYRDQINFGKVDGKSRPRPVNMAQTGSMVNSLKAKANKRSVSITMSDKKASYHNEGTNKIPRRAMLPSRKGEVFNDSITLRLREVVTKVINRILG